MFLKNVLILFEKSNIHLYAMAVCYIFVLVSLSIVWSYHIIFIHSAINEHLSNSCFRTVRIMFLWIGVWFNLEVELLNSRVVLSSIAVCGANLSSKVAVPKLYLYSEHENSFCFTSSPTLGVISLNSTHLYIFVTPAYLSFFVLLYLYILVGIEWYLTVILFIYLFIYLLFY